MASLTREQAYKYREAIVKGSAILTDAEALSAPMLFPRWAVDSEYTIGDRFCYDGELYKVLLDHTSQADWTPDTAVSLYVRVDDPSIEWPEWVPPTGAHDAYRYGAKVSHNGKHWICTIDYCIYEPGTAGWDEVPINE